MLQTLKRHLARDDEEGFTLIELMVVVLIIAILLAIAIPTFLGARDRANDRAAQSSLRNALTAAKTIFTDEQDYTKATASSLAEVEPSITFLADGTSTDHKEVSVKPTDANNWSAAAKSKSGKCFGIRDVTATSGGGTKYGTVSTCTGTGAAGVADSKF